MDYQKELLDIVNIEDCVTGQATREKIHKDFLYHRSVHILVFNLSEELYIQKRVLTKDENPGMWDSSAAGHVDSGEEYETAAHRELQEELGFVEKLKLLGKFKASEQTALEHVCVYYCQTDKTPVPDPREISEGLFLPLPDLNQSILTNKKEYTSTFKLIFNDLLEDGKLNFLRSQ